MADARETDREFDVVLMGATGFTGGLTADYLARHAPDGLRWALAGRDPGRLAAVRDRLAGSTRHWAGCRCCTPTRPTPPRSPTSPSRTRVVATTVGPYLSHGAGLVAACAAAGTDYLDLTGEPEFVDRMYVEHHATARADRRAAGPRLRLRLDPATTSGRTSPCRCCRADEPITMRGVVRVGGTVSGGTFHSFVTATSRQGQARQAARDRRALEPRPEGRASRARSGRPHRDPLLGYWLLPLPTIDPLVVARSGRALPAYGPDFRYSHYAGTKTLRSAATGAATFAGVGLAAQVRPLRSLLLGRVQAGEGPDEARRARSWFTVDLVGEAGGRTVHTRVSGGDPGYGETAKMLGESALCLALDEGNPDVAGQVTTAVAMGDRLLGRLQRAGLRFEVVLRARVSRPVCPQERQNLRRRS